MGQIHVPAVGLGGAPESEQACCHVQFASLVTAAWCNARPSLLRAPHESTAGARRCRKTLGTCGRSAASMQSAELHHASADRELPKRASAHEQRNPRRVEGARRTLVGSRGLLAAHMRAVDTCAQDSSKTLLGRNAGCTEFVCQGAVAVSGRRRRHRDTAWCCMHAEQIRAHSRLATRPAAHASLQRRRNIHGRLKHGTRVRFCVSSSRCAASRSGPRAFGSVSRSRLLHPTQHPTAWIKSLEAFSRRTWRRRQAGTPRGTRETWRAMRTSRQS